MRVLIDESLPRELAAALEGHEARTVQQEGWSSISTVELLKITSHKIWMLPPLSLQTPRLALRPFTAADFETFYATCVVDPTVMAFYHAYRLRQTDTERRARAKQDFLDHFDQGRAAYGYVCWALTTGPTLPPPVGAFIGWCGVLTPALDDIRWGPELAYMLSQKWHGLGLATEAAAAVLADAWARYHLSRIHAVVDSPNVASRRVLDRLGFQLQGPVEVYGSSDMMLYTISALQGGRSPVNRLGASRNI